MRPLLIGEAPCRSGNRAAMLGPAGDRLARYGGYADVDEMLVRFDAVNLLGRWPGSAGKGTAWHPGKARRAARRRPLTRRVYVLLGGRVLAAYRLEALGFGTWLRLDYGGLVAAVPHPSGVNRLYNLKDYREMAGRVLDEALYLLRGDPLVGTEPLEGDDDHPMLRLRRLQVGR